MKTQWESNENQLQKQTRDRQPKFFMFQSLVQMLFVFLVEIVNYLRPLTLLETHVDSSLATLSTPAEAVSFDE